MSHGTRVAETTSATSSTRPAWGRNHHRAATVAAADEHGDGEGLDHAQHDVLQRVDIVDDAGHQVTAAEGGQAGRRQRFESRYTRTRRSASMRKAASWPTSRSP